MIVGSLTPKRGQSAHDLRQPRRFLLLSAWRNYRAGSGAENRAESRTIVKRGRASARFLLLSGSGGAAVAGWRRTLITCVTVVHFAALVTTFRGELPVTSGHFGRKVRLGIGRARQLWLVVLLG